MALIMEQAASWTVWAAWDWYHSWLYRQIVNTEWFMWTIVYAAFGVNFLGPLIAWYIANGKHVVKKWHKARREQQRQQQR